MGSYNPGHSGLLSEVFTCERFLAASFLASARRWPAVSQQANRPAVRCTPKRRCSRRPPLLNPTSWWSTRGCTRWIRRAARGSLRRQERPLHRRRLDRRHPQPRERADASSTPASAHHARLHRLPLPRERRQRVVQRERQVPSRARAARQPQGQGRQDAARPVGRGDHVRRHQARRPLTRKELDEVSRITRSPSNIAAVTRAGTTPKALSSPASPRPRRIPITAASSVDESGGAHRPRRRARARRLQQGRHARAFTPNSSASAAERHGAHFGAAYGGGLTSSTTPAPTAIASSPTGARANGELRHRACFLVRGNDALRASRPLASIYGFGDEWLRIGGSSSWPTARRRNAPCA